MCSGVFSRRPLDEIAGGGRNPLSFSNRARDEGEDVVEADLESWEDEQRICMARCNDWKWWCKGNEKRSGTRIVYGHRRDIWPRALALDCRNGYWKANTCVGADEKARRKLKQPPNHLRRRPGQYPRQLRHPGKSSRLSKSDN